MSQFEPGALISGFGVPPGVQAVLQLEVPAPFSLLALAGLLVSLELAELEQEESGLTLQLELDLEKIRLLAS